jgi:VIT1/CCC1 family predicted Fe2+/Mn2+ transporter
MKTGMMNLVLYAVAFAMGVAIFVLPYVGTSDYNAPLIGIAIICMGLAGIISSKAKKQ